MEGRDLGKIKREGFFTGTKANAFRFQVIGFVIAATLAFGAYKLYYGSRGSDFVISSVMEWDDRYAMRQERIAEKETMRLKAIRQKFKDDEL